MGRAFFPDGILSYKRISHRRSSAVAEITSVRFHPISVIAVPCFLFTAATLTVLAGPTAALAQTIGDATLTITVVDPSGAVIPGATVTVTGADDATKVAGARVVKSSEQGIVTLDRLVPGRYTIRGEFASFEPRQLEQVRVRRGENKHVLVLNIKKLEDSVTVSRDAQAAAADPRGGSFSTTLTREEIAALSDDPDEMAQQLQDMAGGTAVLKVDSFVGARLPPKAQIKSIHIVRDTFAAENHSAEFDEIDIITRPGIGPIRGSFSSRVRDGSMSGRSPFTPTKGPERIQNYEANVSGSLVRNKSSFSLSIDRRHAFDTPIINAELPGGRRSEVVNVRRPNNNWSIYGRLDYAITKDQLLRVAYEEDDTSRRNLGIGGYDLPERAYAAETQDRELRLQEVGPIGRRLFTNTRLAINWVDSRSRSESEATTIRVNDTFTSGGAQVAGGRHPRNIEFASDIDYVRGIHTVRTGALLEGGWFRSDDSTNYLGTFVFTTSDAFAEGRPATYTRRIGDPLVKYGNLETALYVQDDIRLRKNLTLSPGLRYELQTHLDDRASIGPRFGLTWAPFKSGKTTLRTSWGIFYNWLNASTYEQTLRVDGFRQRELNIVNPDYPDPGSSGPISAINRYVLGETVEMPRTYRVSAGIDQTITPKIRVSIAYTSARASRLFRGDNLNAPQDGVRPDPTFANVVAVASDARSRSQQLATTLNVNLAGGTRGANRPLWNWRRSTVRLSYWLGENSNQSTGPFSVSPSGSLATEWGPGPEDRRHRMSASITTQALRNLNANLSLNANTGPPYTITTGFDENGDSIFNDRPTGVGRNSVRVPAQRALSAHVSYSLWVGAPRSDDEGESQPGRYRIALSVNATNLTNHANYTGFSGVMTSPYFMRATAVANPRKIDISVSLGF